MSWSNQRTSMIKGLNFWVRCRTTAVTLGTQPSNPNIHRDFIASKNPDVSKIDEEVAAVEMASTINQNPDVAADDVDLQMTVFPRARFFQDDADGRLYDPEYDIIPEGADGQFVILPFIYDYQMRGSFKESIAMLAKASGGKAAKAKAKKEKAEKEAVAKVEPAVDPATGEVVEPAPKKRGRRKKSEIEAEKAAAAAIAEAAANARRLIGDAPVAEIELGDEPNSAHYDCADITAYKKVVDGNWFVTTRKIPLILPEFFYDQLGNQIPTFDEHGRLHTLQRALRAETAKGPRTALATSEIVPVGTEFFFGVKLLNEKNLKACLETLDYKADMGMLQWRGGGKGTLIWTLCNREGVPYDDLYEDQLTAQDRAIIDKVNAIIPGCATPMSR